MFATLQAALPSLRKSERGGRVVFVSSGSAVGATPAWAAYNGWSFTVTWRLLSVIKLISPSASKAALNSLCRTFAQEEPDIVSVALRPGKVDTEVCLLSFLTAQRSLYRRRCKVFYEPKERAT